MVDFLQLQKIVGERLALDRAISSVTAKGPTLDEAVSQAATLLNVPVRHLEYEIVEKGSPGFLGSGKKEWTVNAYPRLTTKSISAKKEETEKSEDTTPVIEDVDGDAFLHLTPDGIFLKVTPPLGAGRAIEEADALKIITDRSVTKVDEESVKAVVREARGEYIKIKGEFEYRSMNNSTVAVAIPEGEMTAFLTVTPPGLGGYDLPMESYLTHLKSNRVVYGVDEEMLRKFADRPTYKEKIAIAEGTKPVNGGDAYIQYNFETDQTKVKLREGSNGRIDFKDLNIIQNVVQNQPLARKVPPKDGISGRTVTGKLIPAKNGRDIPLPLGKNVHVGDDGSTIIADINGQVILASGKINVEPVYTVQGDVNLKTGNIIFLGTVIVNGNIEDGFSVKAAGNIEVNGTVERAELDAEGDIIVHQGITGKNSGMMIRAGRSLWARFIENSVIEAGSMVIVSDGIINSQVNAYKRIVCQGKRAHIVGGHLRASEEINAKILGSPTSGTDTICEVGVDPKSKIRLETLAEKKGDTQKKFDEVQRNLQTLINIKKQRKSLPEEKETAMRELMDQRQLHAADLAKIQEEESKILEFLNAIKIRGKVSASSKVYPGVKILIRDAVNDVRTEYKAATFILEDGLIRVVKYEEPDDDVTKAPDGYAAY